MTGPSSSVTTRSAASRLALCQSAFAGGGGPPYQTTVSADVPTGVRTPVEVTWYPLCASSVATVVCWFGTSEPSTTEMWKAPAGGSGWPFHVLKPGATPKIESTVCQPPGWTGNSTSP